MATQGVVLNLNVGNLAESLRLLIILTLIAVSPLLLAMFTSFTRIIVVLSFLRRALGLQTTPSNQILIALALILTFYTMAGVIAKINSDCIEKYLKGEKTFQQALKDSTFYVKKFMVNNVSKKSVLFFSELANFDLSKLKKMDDIPWIILAPAFVVSELKIAFQIGIIIMLPFLVIDLVVASVIMGMGMMMLPPAMISLPFKVLLFVMIDGWHLVIGSLVRSFS